MPERNVASNHLRGFAERSLRNELTDLLADDRMHRFGRVDAVPEEVAARTSRFAVDARWGYDVARDGSAFYVAGCDTRRPSQIVFVSDITADLPSGRNVQLRQRA